MRGRLRVNQLLTPEFREILSEFCAGEVKYLLVGAYALAVHGLPRATGDIDLWVRRDPENAIRVWEALARFGAPMAQVHPSDFEQADLVFQVGVAPRRVDVITGVDGLDFDEAWERRTSAQVEGLAVPVVCGEDLLRNKRASGRPKDLGDVAFLEEILRRDGAGPSPNKSSTS